MKFNLTGPKEVYFLWAYILKEDLYIKLIVSDNGLGISKENFPKGFGMFKRFHQHVDGTGVGAYIVKRMVENADGKIELESEEGKGTNFVVYFRATS